MGEREERNLVTERWREAARRDAYGPSEGSHTVRNNVNER
jgi:hypothetical protein